jgi:hypothetical protein
MAPPIAYLSLEEVAKLVRAQPKQDDFLISESLQQGYDRALDNTLMLHSRRPY